MLSKHIDKIRFCVILIQIDLRGKVKFLTGGCAESVYQTILLVWVLAQQAHTGVNYSAAC